MKGTLDHLSGINTLCQQQNSGTDMHNFN